jgi:hypothetical protein
MPTAHAKRTRSKQQTDPYAYRRQLPFMSFPRGSTIWWNPQATGNYQKDCQTGIEYAIQFWKVCGSRGDISIDLSQILIGLHVQKRPRHRYQSGALADSNLSGVEIGFLRTIGDLVAASVATAVMSGFGPDRVLKGDLPRKEGNAKAKAAAGLTIMLAEARHKRLAA